MLKSEMSRAASMFQAAQARFVGVLEAYRDKLPAAEARAGTRTGAGRPRPAAGSCDD